ncbi:DUF3622 domain-containing protein [Gilvimarinus sp. SDUM040013]|uniref:DUF3622 domain-containing protein n=1 Tax=Gilvimarinus gilvus TaxID=3058038 RepID=A0ABU4RVY8_9GAMM|nr:DUF3622 domain-containing protein [Gilvimarinus sp. SDUM040013]MDO3387356.1 DUF3622 domain-containing protein [Gilvimarinus sp. SDUM040013]MDX6849045.1 DUF3622 domain-containing protein [Gilvimarinus sp. SDUM040013]
MTTGKKYDYRIIESAGTWRAELTRRATARKTVVSKAQGGFATEADATAWAETELKALLANVHARQQAKK